MKRAVPVVLAVLATVVFGQDWQPASGGKVTQWATPAGYEADGTPLFIIRAPFSGGVHIGKANPNHSSGYIPWGGKENPVAQYEVYAGGGRWVRGNAQSVPAGAISGGREDNGSPLFIIRAPFGGGLHPGKFSPAYKKAYIPYGGQERELTDFEILVADWQPLQGMNVPQAALGVGAEANGTPLFIIRARQGGGLHPGKLNTAFGTGYVPYGGREIELKAGMEIFVGSGVWVKAAGGAVPFGAIKGGTDNSGSPLFIIRAPVGGGVHPGKLSPEFKMGYVPYGGREMQINSYEVLVYDFGGKIRGTGAAASAPAQPPQVATAPSPPPPQPQVPSPRRSDDVRRSARGDRAVQLVISNETSGALNLVWLDYAGKEVPYAQIEPGGSFTQGTFETHAWAVRAANGFTFGHYLMGPEPQQVLRVQTQR